MDRGILSSLSFPVTRAVLWDETPKGQKQTLQLTAQRPLALTVLGRTLSLAEKHASRSKGSSFSGFLIGHPSVSPEDNSLVVAIDRFDPGRHPKQCGSQTHKQPTAVVPGDYVVPVRVWNQPGGDQSLMVFTGLQYKEAIQQLHENCCSESPLNISDTFTIHCSCSSLATGDKGLEIHAEVVLVGWSLEASPVASIPVIQTALARTLTIPDGLTQVAGLPKCGYMTMDQTRKLLLLLQTDPKASSLPLVGIWMTGIDSVTHPNVWAACMHFMLNKNLTDRVLTASNRFLLLLYLQSDPHKLEFWSCRLMKEDPFVSLHSCREKVNLEEAADEPYLFELIPVIDGPRLRLFTDTISGLQFQHAVQSSDCKDFVPCESLPRAQPCQPTALLPVVIPTLSSTCDLSLCVEEASERNQQHTPTGSENSRLSVRLPLQPVNTGSKSHLTSSPLESIKQSWAPSATATSESKENQSATVSTQSIQSSHTSKESITGDLVDSFDGNSESSVMACRLLKRQEEQLKQMQLQIEKLLGAKHELDTHSVHQQQQQSERQENRETCQTSSGSNPASCMPEKMSVSTNTGRSLMWPSQSSAVATEQDDEVNPSDSSSVDELSPLSSCISVHQEADRTHSLTSSVHAVDLQSFNGDSTEMSASLMRDNRPGTLSQLSSPAFGESASQAGFVPGDCERVQLCRQTDKLDECDTTDRMFHNMVDRIQVLLKEQDSPAQQQKQPSPQSSIHHDNQPTNRTPRSLNNSRSSHAVGLNKDRVMQVLFGNPKKCWMTPPDRSGAPAINEHPRINYMSLSVNETMDETFDESDVIALRYLTNVSHPDFTHVLGHQHDLNSFELPQTMWQASPHPNGCDSFYDRNLSLASRQYLRRHNLLPEHQEQQSTETSADASQHSIEDMGMAIEGHEHVLDVHRLKNLPKLF